MIPSQRKTSQSTPRTRDADKISPFQGKRTPPSHTPGTSAGRREAFDRDVIFTTAQLDDRSSGRPFQSERTHLAKRSRSSVRSSSQDGLPKGPEDGQPDFNEIEGYAAQGTCDAGQMLESYLGGLACHPRGLTGEQVSSLVKAGEAGDESAWKLFLAAYVRLVATTAQKYAGHGVPLQDLIQEGMIGLLHAAKLFDPGRGVKFSTYAHWWIKQTISRAANDQSRFIHIPDYAEQQLAQIRRTADILAQQLGREPTSLELAKQTEVAVTQVETLLTMTRSPLYLVSTEDDEATDPFLVATELIDESIDEAALFVDQQHLRDRIAGLLSVLSEREQHIIRLHYGLDERQANFEEIGALLCISRARVQQIEHKAMLKLQRVVAEQQLNDWLSEGGTETL